MPAAYTLNGRTAKDCTWCYRVLAPEDFHFNKRRSDGRQSHCRACQRQKCRMYNMYNSDKRRVTNQAYRARLAER